MCKKGRFIVFEGVDGCGKTSQLLRLQKKISDLGLSCNAQKEPTDGIVGRIIRDTIEKKIDLREETLALLFAADRHEHIHTEIFPFLHQGTHVLCDRYVFSNLAYQSMSLSMEAILSYNQKNIDTLLPDLTVFIDTSPEECIRRIAVNREQTERYETLEQIRKIRENYEIALSHFEPTLSIVRINGDQSREAVFDAIWQSVQPLL